MSAQKADQLAKLSQMTVGPLLASSGGSLITRRSNNKGRTHDDADDDAADASLRATFSADSREAILMSSGPPEGRGGYSAPIERTISCPEPAGAQKNESGTFATVLHDESESEGTESASSSLTCSASSNHLVRTRAAPKSVTLVPPLQASLEALEREDSSSESCSSGETRYSRSRRSWGSVMAAEGSLVPQLAFPERKRSITSSEDSGMESGVESGREESSSTAGEKKKGRRARGRSLQLTRGTVDTEVAAVRVVTGLRRSKETEDVDLGRKNVKKDTKIKMTQSTDSISSAESGAEIPRMHSDESEGRLSSKRSREKRREDSKREKREKKELKAKEKENRKKESGSTITPRGPLAVRRKVQLQPCEGIPISPRGGASVQCLLQVGDNVWAADSSGRVTVINSKGDVEKEFVVSTKRLYSMILVDKKNVWISGEDSVIRVYQAAKFKKVKDLLSHRSMVRCMEVVHNGDKVQVWSGDIEGNVIVWDGQKMRKETEFCVQQGEAIFTIRALPHSVWVTASGEIYRVSLRKLEVETGWTAHNRPITDLLYLENENVIVSCADDGILRVWKEHYSGVDNYSSLQSEASLRPASLVREITSTSNVLSLCLASPRSGLLFCAGHADGAISLMDSEMKETARLKGDSDDYCIRSLLLIRQDEGKGKNNKRPDTLWSATREGSIHLWDWTSTAS